MALEQREADAPAFTMDDWHRAGPYERAEIERVWQQTWERYQQRRLIALEKSARRDRRSTT